MKKIWFILKNIPPRTIQIKLLKKHHKKDLDKFLARCKKYNLCTRTDSKVVTTKRQFEVLTTANCCFVVKSLIETFGKSNAKGVLIWEHYGISTSNNHL